MTTEGVAAESLIGAGARGYALTITSLTLRPSALAAREMVPRVTLGFSGSSRRSSWAREVDMRRASVTLETLPFSMRSEIFSAMARLMATASTSSRMPSSARKLSKLLPR